MGVIGVYESLWLSWVSIGFYGFLSVYRYLWAYMGVYGSLWVPIGVYGFLGVYGCLWISMGIHRCHGCLFNPLIKKYKIQNPKI